MSVAMHHPEVAVVVEGSAVAHGIRTGMIVCCRDGAIGRVVGLAPEWAEQPTHLIVQTGPLVPQEIAIPLHWVAEVTPDQVVLQARRRHLERLVPRVTDEQIAAEVREALYNAPILRANDAFLAIEVAVQDHVVTLRGNVRTLWRSLLAETIARRTPAVWDVRNELIGDDEVEDAVLQAFRHEPRLRSPRLYVQSTLGEVTLRGQVRSPEEAALVVLLARRVAGVRTINNEIVVVESSHAPPSPLIDTHTLFATRRAQRVSAS